MLHIVSTLVTLMLIAAMSGIIMVSLRDSFGAIAAALSGDVSMPSNRPVVRRTRVRWATIKASSRPAAARRAA